MRHKGVPMRYTKPAACPYCGAKYTNTGTLLHYGKYFGYACRSYFYAEDFDEFATERMRKRPSGERSIECKIDERVNARFAEMEAAKKGTT